MIKLINWFKVSRFNNYGDGCVLDDGSVIKFKGYRCMNGKYIKTYSVSKSVSFSNCGGYSFKGLFRRMYLGKVR